MKNLLSLLTSAALILSLGTEIFAQTAQCGNGRYHDGIFPYDPVITKDVQYGSNTKYDGSTQTLLMDIYEPACDVTTDRPLVIFCHGGAFMTGDKTDMDTLCKIFARLGYVTATIGYRIGGAQADILGAQVRAMHDARAAIRWFRKDVATNGNTYRIDPNSIYFGGASAGGYTSLNVAYMDQSGELISSVDDGTIEGNSGNPGYSSDVKAIVSICGAIYDVNFIQSNDIPVCLIHGDQDNVVPINGGFGNYGSQPISSRCSSTGTEYCFLVAAGEGHQIGPAYFDDIVVLIRDFIEKQQCGGTLTCQYTSLPAVYPIPAASVAIAQTTGTNPACAGASVTFTATPANGGSSPSYQWYKNGSPVSGATNATFTTSSLADGNVITCGITSNADCVSPLTATSSGITMNILPVPSVTAAATDTVICSGDPVGFTATPANNGTSTTYQWKVNGNAVSGATSATYTSSSLANGSIVTAVMNTNSSCGSSVTSNAITINHATSVTATADISATPSGPVCQGTPVTFNAAVTHAGTSPSYQWKVNGADAGSGTSAYTPSSWNDGDEIELVFTSNSSCVSNPVVTSNTITLVAANPTPSATIIATDTSLCTGDSVTFTATPVDGGANPSYQWKINGTNAGTGSPVFSTVLTNGVSVITVNISAFNATCSTTLSDVSNAISVVVSSPVNATVAIAGSDDSICAGNTIVFTATPVNPGSNPAYQWQINGLNVGTNSATYSTASLVNGQSVTCIITPACGTGGTSNMVAPHVTPTPVVNPLADFTVCGGSLGASGFTSNPPGASFVWTNSDTATGLPAGGTGDVPAFTAVNATGAPITSSITVNPTLNGCPGIPYSYDITVNPTPVIIQNGNVLTTSSVASSYQWYLNGVSIPGATSSSYTATQNGNYGLTVGAGDCPAEVVNINNIGMEESALGCSFTIFPNPTNGIFTLSLESQNSEYVMRIKNTLGQLIHEEEIHTANGVFSHQVDVSGLESGIYFISLANKGGESVQKIVRY